jgi:hypothetical protein
VWDHSRVPDRLTTARLTPALGLIVTLLALSLSACGGGGASATGGTSSATDGTSSATNGGGGSTAGTGATATKMQFAASAKAICRELTAKEQPLKSHQASLKGLPTQAANKAFVSLVEQLVALSSAASAKLDALPRPSADAGPIKTLLAGFSEEVADVRDIATAVASEDSTAGESAASSIRRLSAAYASLASSYGMNGCLGSE